MLVFSWTNFAYIVLFKFWVCFTYSAIPAEVWEVTLAVAEGKNFASLSKNLWIFVFIAFLLCFHVLAVQWRQKISEFMASLSFGTES